MFTGQLQSPAKITKYAMSIHQVYFFILDSM